MSSPYIISKQKWMALIGGPMIYSDLHRQATFEKKAYTHLGKQTEVNSGQK